MLDKSLHHPTEQFLQTLKKLGEYGRRPQGIAVLGSIGLHGLAALTIPFWSTPEAPEAEPEKPGMVRVIDLPPEVQNRLPSTSAALDLSVFESSPDFNLDLSGLNGQAIAPNLNGTYIPGLNLLPTPVAPNLGQNNFSFVPISPPPIASSFTGFTPPPPPRNMSFLPPPPNVPIQGSPSFSPPPSISNSNADQSLTPPNPRNSSNQQEFTITPNPELVQRQRQLEEEAAIALRPRTNNPNGEIRFEADLLKPQELRNGNSGSNPNRPATPGNAPSQTARNSTPVNRALTGTYPKGACSNQASGTAIYNVGVSPEGIPSQLNLVQSSGSNALDSQANQDIRNARFDGKNTTYRVSINYQYNASFCAAFAPKPQVAPPSAPPAPARTEPKPEGAASGEASSL
ncbi:MAG: TonB family protein [Synechococcus sp.]|nr:TonB family protein [Synechococcus sp.]